MNELTSTQVIDLPCRRQGGYRARRSPGEQFRVLRDALNRERILREQSGDPDEWLNECVRWADQGCLPK